MRARAFVITAITGIQPRKFDADVKLAGVALLVNARTGIASRVQSRH